MSVLIKGMEMPKPKLTDMATVYNAYVLVRPNGPAAIVVDNEDGLDSTEYPLVPVPPHKRLIDADALYSHIKDEQRKCNDPYEGWSECQVALGFVNTAPTIIPAEEAQP